MHVVTHVVAKPSSALDCRQYIAGCVTVLCILACILLPEYTSKCCECMRLSNLGGMSLLASCLEILDQMAVQKCWILLGVCWLNVCDAGSQELLGSQCPWMLFELWEPCLP